MTASCLRGFYSPTFPRNVGRVDTRAGAEGQDPPEVAGRDVTYGVVAVRVVEDIEEVDVELHGF